eukprot:TRINITY_DN72093_c0_g1_i3.p2 TRINITY_DN72093_c0_g1~~TRINITY_DN72093_c0_g1_i3.p2  ORF type:complete len:142 (-),score=20.18 TRINITY_DN72093_c0_g1_i3:139-528(-)
MYTLNFSPSRLLPKTNNISVSRFCYHGKLYRKTSLKIFAQEEPEKVEAPKVEAEVKEEPAPAVQGKTAYIDELKEPPKEEMSAEMKARLRKEYTSWGGSPGTAMGANYFLWIIVVVAVLAVLTKLTGAI